MEYPGDPAQRHATASWLISYYRHLQEHEGVEFAPRLVVYGAPERLRPILMTALATGLAVLPLVVAGEIPGHEIEHPMAVVIVGGFLTSTLLNRRCTLRSPTNLNPDRHSEPNRGLAGVRNRNSAPNGGRALVAGVRGASVWLSSSFRLGRGGNVWNFGQYAELYTNGTVTGAPMTWLAGLSRADAGGPRSRRPAAGIDPGLDGGVPAPDVEFLDCAKDVKSAERTCVPTACYDGVRVVDERSGEDPTSGVQRKYCAPGVGGVRVEAVGDPEDETLELAKVVAPNADTLAAARRGALDLEKHAYQVSAMYRQTTPATR